MDNAWADALVDTLIVHERVVHTGGRDWIDFATLILLAANAVLLYFTVRGTLKTAREARLASQTQLVAPLLARLFSQKMVDAVALLELVRTKDERRLRLYPQDEVDDAKVLFMRYGWQVGSLLEAGLLDVETAKVVMPFGHAEDYEDILRDDPYAEAFRKLHGLATPPEVNQTVPPILSEDA